MKILKTLCLLAFAAVMPAMLTSCDDDDEPSSSASSSSSSYSGPYFGLRDCGKVISRILIRDAFGFEQYSFVYDGSGRVVKVYYDDDEENSNETVSYDYDSQTGKAVEEYDSDIIISFDADANGRFNSLTYEYSRDNDKVAHEFKYNSDGNVISVVRESYYIGYPNDEIDNCTFVWDGDLLTSVRHSYDDGNGYISEHEWKITYSDVDNKYRTPLYGLNTMLSFGLYPNELSIAPAKLPIKIDVYYGGSYVREYVCRYTLDDEGFIESEYIEDNADGEEYADVRYTYADKEF